MRVLLVNHYAGHPSIGMEFRPYYLAKEWLKQGHQVEIIGCSFSHLRQAQPKADKFVTQEIVDGIRYTWLWAPSYTGNGIGRVFNVLIFSLALCIFLLSKRSQQSDVVIASSTHPLDVVGCRLFAKRWQVPFIYEVHDLWPLSPIELGGLSPKNPLMRLFQWAENLAYKTCDAVVSILPCTLSHMTEHGLHPDKFHHIPNGVALEDWQESKPLNPTVNATIGGLKAQGTFLLGYAGAHGPANNLQALLNACRHLDPKIAVCLIGHGSEKLKLESLAKEMGLQNIFFFPSVPKNQVPDLLAQMDALFISLAPQPLFRFGVSPNKLFDYFMAGKPVVYAVRSGNHPVLDYGCGLEAPPDNPKEIAAVINQLSRTDAQARALMGQKAKEAVLKYFTYSQLANQFSQVIEKATAQRTHDPVQQESLIKAETLT